MNKDYVYVKGKILFSIFLIAFLLFSTSEVNVAAASPETTYFYVDPSEVRDVQPGDTFLITIKVADAPPSYSWEVHVSWDPNIFEMFYKVEGDFLSSKGNTFFSTYPPTPPWDEANLQGEIMVGCSLTTPGLPMNEWVSGSGELCMLGFNVMAEGSSVINLFDTLLIDHLVAGAAQGVTYYPNLDGFFYNTLFHDIAITSVTRAQTAELVSINVTVTNGGNYTETSETFNATVYADIEVHEYEYDTVDQLIKNTTVVGDEITVGTKIVTEDLAPGATTTLTFTWNTTGIAGGTYTISAEVMGDDDTRDNLFIDGTVTVKARNIAVTSVVPSSTEVTVGENVTINVTVENDGQFNETFDVTVYYDNTSIETKTDISLENGTSTTLAFIWDTTDVTEDTYTIKAEASEVPDEIDTDDNTRIDGTVKVGGAAAPDILPYVAVVIVIIIVAAIAVYFIWFRKPT